MLLLLLLLLLRQVLEAEASSPLVTAQHLQDAGQLPRVLAQGTAGGLVATPAAAERQEMYHKETEYTGACVSVSETVACCYERSNGLKAFLDQSRIWFWQCMCKVTLRHCHACHRCT
jgi:hypothetical protein